MAADVWTFCNSLNPGQKLQVLGLASAQEFVRFLRHEELSTWTVEEQGGKAVRDCAQLFSAAPTMKPGAPVIKLLPNAETRSGELRSQRRVEANYGVALYLGKNFFKSFTKNVSSGGLLLQDPVPPEFHMNICRIVIDSGDNLLNLEFTGKVLSSSKIGSRIKFEGEAAHLSLQKLLAFIDHHEKKQKGKRSFKIG